MEVSWKDKWERLHKKMENQEERAGEMIALGIDTLVMHVTGLGVAYLHGRKGGMPAIARMPVDALFTGVANFAGWTLMAFGMPWGRHFVAAANGTSIWWLGGVFAKMGNEARKKAGKMVGTAPPGPTTEDQEKAGVQYRTPIIFGDRHAANQNGGQRPFVQNRGFYGNENSQRHAA